MSGQHHTDRAKTKPGDLRAEVAQRVGLTAKEQALCRIDGWKMAMRKMVDAYGPAGAEMAEVFGQWGVDRWGELFDATD